MVTAAPIPKTTEFTSAAPTVRPIPMTRPRPAGKTPSTAKAGNIITASRTMRNDPSSISAATSRNGSASSAASVDSTA